MDYTQVQFVLLNRVVERKLEYTVDWFTNESWESWSEVEKHNAFEAMLKLVCTKVEIVDEVVLIPSTDLKMKLEGTAYEEPEGTQCMVPLNKKKLYDGLGRVIFFVLNQIRPTVRKLKGLTTGDDDFSLVYAVSLYLYAVGVSLSQHLGIDDNFTEEDNRINSLANGAFFLSSLWSFYIREAVAGDERTTQMQRLLREVSGISLREMTEVVGAMPGARGVALSAMEDEAEE